MARQHIAEGWDSFEKAVMPENAGPTQRTEMRNSFYAGALFLFSRLMIGLSEGDEPQQEDLDMMSDIQKEFEDYQR